MTKRYTLSDANVPTVENALDAVDAE